MSQHDIQSLIDHCHQMAEHLLIQQNGEFYPFGAQINSTGEVTHIAHYDGDEFPLSEVKIRELRKVFGYESKSERIRAYAITYDCLVRKEPTSEKTDAIAIECFSNQESKKTTFYFPYQKVSDDRLEFGEAWGQEMKL
jgi:hypothetical protein